MLPWVRCGMRGIAVLAWPVVLVFLAVLAVSAAWPAPARAAGPVAAASPPAAATKIPNATCLMCHGVPGFAMKQANGKMRSLSLAPGKFEHSVHGSLNCVDCHTNIRQVPHPPTPIVVDCISCHEKRWAAAVKAGKQQQFATLGFVVQQIHRFMGSVHAQPSSTDQSRTNATCYDCHDAHYVYPPGTPVWTRWRLHLPYTCGNCHAAEFAAYATSIHGRLVLQDHDTKAAICADCHSTHGIRVPTLTSSELLITHNCGNCHREQLQTYLESYHGQVNALGYAYTAKCFDCHGYHRIQLVDDPRSTVFPANRLATCRKCHTDASPGFATFEPHGNSHDIEHYPLLWIAGHFMTALLAGVFAFFWTHSALWFYRSYQERKQRIAEDEAYYDIWSFRPQRRQDHQQGQVWFRRFPLLWRIAHLIFLLTTMTLVLTGMTALYATTFWAPEVARFVGGPEVLATIHHTCAAIFLSVFVIHIVIMTFKLGARRKPFQWFGPDSLVVRWQDLEDIMAMFRWFFGLGPRPVFERWTYWEKFDYWAVFWGVAVIGGSGCILYFRIAVTRVLPGWVLNVATIVHGEEAILAAVFLFTVHFFNNHFRPADEPGDFRCPEGGGV